MSTVPGTVDAAPAPRADRRPGYLSIDSQPYATIYVDGKKVGETPLLKLALPPGKRRIRAVRADGQEKRLTVEIRPGKLARPVNLRW
jgi:serine/threonine-protein kinase